MPNHDWTVMSGGRVECSRCHYLRECSHHDRNHPDEQCDDCNGPCPTTPTPDPKVLTEEKRYTFPPSEPMDDAQCDTINPWTGAGFHNWTADERRLWATIDSLRARAEQAEKLMSDYVKAATEHYPPNWGMDPGNAALTISNIVRWHESQREQAESTLANMQSVLMTLYTTSHLLSLATSHVPVHDELYNRCNLAVVDSRDAWRWGMDAIARAGEVKP